jgi:hypothetical protein
MDIQVIRNNISDLRADIARLRNITELQTNITLGIGVLLGINCIATMVLALAVWSTTGNGG